MRDYRHLDRYLNILIPDVYPQPPDELQSRYAQEVIGKWLPQLTGLESVLCVGCGQGVEMGYIAGLGKNVVGVTLGEDYAVCQAKGLEVYQADMSFLPFDVGQFDLVFARHVLEHSPMPLLTLMEWHRVAKQWLCAIVPDPRAFQSGGRNHYYVLSKEQWRPLFSRAGWAIIWEEDSRDPFEHRFMC